MSLLKVEGLNKIFGGHYALSDVHMDIRPGEVHALVGENGAGKSTFIKIVTGVYSPDGGTLLWKGKAVTINDPGDAREIGINVVHQDRHLIPSFTGYENLFLGLKYPSSGVGVKWKAMQNRAKSLMEEYGVKLDMNKTAERMSPPERTMLEILRAMMLECNLLILDEPTASLTDQESEQLFSLIGKLIERGTSILYVSHRMDEIFRLSHRITVFRNGQHVATVNRAETDRDGLISLMNNKEYKKAIRIEREGAAGKPVLEVRNVTTVDGKVKGVSLDVREKEIVGLFGLAGAGRTELLETIYGLRRKSSGDVVIRGELKSGLSPRASLDEGVVLIPEERKRDALVMGMTIRENITLPVLKKFSSGWKLRGGEERKEAEGWMEDLKVKASGTEQEVGQLSGGNQQKVVFAKALMSSPFLYLCDEPTQAVDIMTREQIHRLLREQADAGGAVLFVSSDLQEVLDIADRLYVLHEGRVVADLPNRDVTPENVLAYCFGQGKDRDQS
ncbi:sugar ABC transporter ATP-binding protein [Paenibacillus sp. J5C_2022]|uniref:sugar ABC transporter ATP-binding protein n=1 Tax=Paenibacillus sp. J5C2022 TaxID=2977129 RepID=UPI0021CFC890|nr:sugar ABC transporter ATP-binding protein [Paenibacillus sp. J5C2022]MCU6709575.1 sugar ABC transporter ATP-binding protein [Paenibacillus sp. J5C2022]